MTVFPKKQCKFWKQICNKESQLKMKLKGIDLLNFIFQSSQWSYIQWSVNDDGC